jgi:hypothetical protein
MKAAATKIREGGEGAVDAVAVTGMPWVHRATADASLPFVCGVVGILAACWARQRTPAMMRMRRKSMRACYSTQEHFRAFILGTPEGWQVSIYDLQKHEWVEKGGRIPSQRPH